MNVRKYKGWEIHKQYVGPMGWNVVNPDGRCVKTGFSSLASAREYINNEIEYEELRWISLDEEQRWIFLD